MVSTIKRKTSLPLDAETLDGTKELGINCSAEVEAALISEVVESRGKKWLAENAQAFPAQSDWHERNGHPLTDIITSPGGTSWMP